MIDKILIIGCIILAIAAASLGGVSYVRGLKIDTLTADKALIKTKLDSANGDLEVSDKNHNRIVAEKDKLLSSMMDQADAEREAAVSMARISKDVDNAPEGDTCANSAPIDAMLDGLRNEQTRSGGRVAPDNRVPAAGPAGKATGLP